MAEKSVSSQSSIEDDDYEEDDDHSESSESSSSSSDDEDEAEEKEDADAYEIRMKAYNLINQVGDVPPSKAQKAAADAKKKKDNMTVLEESFSTIQNVITGVDLINDVEEADRTEKIDKTQWPSKPDPKSFQSYQQQQQQQQQSKSSSRTNANQQQRRQDDINEQQPRMMRIGGQTYHEEHDDDDHTNSAGMVGTLALGVVSCVSEACKLGASNMINFQSINSGYQTIKSAVIPEVEDRIFGNASSHGQPSGTFQTVDYSSTSYGGGGSGYMNRGRYSDIP